MRKLALLAALAACEPDSSTGPSDDEPMPLNLVFGAMPDTLQYRLTPFAEPLVVRAVRGPDTAVDYPHPITPRAYTDAACTTPAPGVLAANGPLTRLPYEGEASFTTITYDQAATLHFQGSAE